jgi:hypothetical protein
MILSINQPAFIPWLGYFHRIAISDLHIVLDHVQFEKNSFTNRNKILTPEGAKWLTIPVSTSGAFGNLAISKIQIMNNSKWQKKILETLKQFYKKAPYFDAYYPFIEEIVSKDRVFLNDLMTQLNNYFLSVLNIRTPLVYSSQIEVDGTKSELVLNLCKKYNASKYISGTFGKDYLDLSSFKTMNIEVFFHEYKHPVYRQLQNQFEPYMSIVDLLFNEGPKSSDIIMSGNENIKFTELIKY